MVYSRETKIYRQDARKKGNGLTPQQREELVKPYLPLPPKAKITTPRRRLSQSARDIATDQLHLLVYTIMHTIFSIYIRIRQTYHICVDKVFAILYYHHKAPELIRQDVKNLTRLPEHLSIILELKGEEKGTAGLEALMDEVAEISAWCACVGIPMLSVYEKTGAFYGSRKATFEDNKTLTLEQVYSKPIFPQLTGQYLRSCMPTLGAKHPLSKYGHLTYHHT